MSEPIMEHQPSSPEPAAEHFTMDDFQVSYLALFYATLFHPIETFKTIARTSQRINRLVFFGIISIVLVSALAPMVRLATEGGQLSSLVWAMPLSVVGGMFGWGFMGLLVSLLAYAFTGKSKAGTFLALSGLATLPWILMGPVTMLKIGLGPVGVVFFALLALAIWLWSVLLFALALAETYDMTPERVLIILVAPFTMSLVLFAWFYGFIHNIRQLAFHG